MREKAKLFLIIFLSAFIMSFVGSLLGLAFTAVVFGYINHKTAVKLKVNFKTLSIARFLAMEMGFLLSSFLHIGVLPKISVMLHITIGLLMGLIFYVLGILIKKYELIMKEGNIKKSYLARITHLIF